MCFKLFHSVCMMSLLIMGWRTVSFIGRSAHIQCLPTGNSDEVKWFVVIYHAGTRLASDVK